MSPLDVDSVAGLDARVGRAAARQARRAFLLDPLLVHLPPIRFVMGSDNTRGARLYCGESPAHSVCLDAYAIMSVPVTNGLYGLWRPESTAGLAPDLPVVDVTWFDACQFADWIGGRLPTEAEWESACAQYTHPLDCAAWYSETSGNRLHAVGKRIPTSAGVFDLLGNVWEWCIDTYDSTYYARSPTHNPVNAVSHGDRVCRGGALNSFADMCRPQYRYHEPPDYWAADLGFRLAADVLPEGVSAYSNVPNTVSASKRCSENESKEHDD